MSVAFVNLVLGVITKRLTELERHETLDGMQLAQGQRLFLISFVNTGILTLIVNSNFFKTTVFNGASHDDFTPAWYAQVGTSMLLTMVSGAAGLTRAMRSARACPLSVCQCGSAPLLALSAGQSWSPSPLRPRSQCFNIFTPHAAPIFRWIVSACCRARGVAGIRTQRDLNERFLGPEFHLSTRYAQLLNTVGGEYLSCVRQQPSPAPALRACITYIRCRH